MEGLVADERDGEHPSSRSSRASSPALEWVSAGIELFAIVDHADRRAALRLAFLGAEVSRVERRRECGGINGGRVELSRYILAGLELFIVSDIIRTALIARR